jgi:hypothetical protein
MLLCPIITKTLTGVSPAAHLGGVMGGTTGCHGPGGGDGGALTETRLGMAAATPIERARLSIVYAIWTVCVCVCVCVWCATWRTQRTAWTGPEQTSFLKKVCESEKKG